MEAANILMVEDDESIRALVLSILGDLGHRVQSAETAEQGLALFDQGLFDVVLSDVNLPGIDGIEMVRRIRRSDPTVVPVIMTARRDQQTAVSALECGVRSFLMKPFSRDDLEVRIDIALEERKRVVDTRILVGDLIQTRSALQHQAVEREQALTRTERYLKHLLDAAPFGIYSTDRRGRILTFNGEAEQMYGYAHDEIVGSEVSVLFSEQDGNGRAPDPEDPGAAMKAHHIRKNGDRFAVMVRCRDILGLNRESIAKLYVVEDLSEHERMETQLLYADRLSLLGQLAPRIAHEFKTPLQVITGHAGLAEEWLKDGKVREARDSLGHICPAADRMLGLVHQMTDLGKPSDARQTELDLRVEVERTLEPLQELGAVKYCQIVRDYDADLPNIRGDSEQVEQVYRNLIVNAVQAMGQGRGRTLTLSLQTSEDGCWVETVVGDSGPGIPDEDLEQIFHPFFTTKSEGEGTGLGLPIVKTIVDRHSGKISVNSIEGEGTQFSVTFPVLEKE
jgi:PAS domain S-box-containing protein